MNAKPSFITGLMGLVVALISLGLFIVTIYFSTAPTPTRVENLIEALYILTISLGFMLLSIYFKHTGR